MTKTYIGNEEYSLDFYYKEIVLNTSEIKEVVDEFYEDANITFYLEELGINFSSNRLDGLLDELENILDVNGLNINIVDEINDEVYEMIGRSITETEKIIKG